MNPKTRATGTMTESAFLGMLRSMLRRKSMYWRPIRETLDAARRVNQSNNSRLKWEYKCAICTKWFPKKVIDVDHIKPAGTLCKVEDLPNFVNNLFCERDNLQVLCRCCHDKKTKKI